MDLTNGKCYIGRHKWNKPGIDLNYWGSGAIISNVVDKRKREGRMDTLLREKLMDCATLDELNYFETYFIEHLNTRIPYGYNFQKGGDCHEGQVAWNKGKKLPKDFRDKCAHAAKKRWEDPEYIVKQSNARKGKRQSEETKAKLSAINTKYYFTEEQLYNLYIKDNLSAAYIARLFGCSLSVVVRRLKKYKISKK